MLRYRVRAIILTAGMICAFSVGWSPVRSQEAEVDETAVEEVQEEAKEVELPTGDPTAAITTGDVNIPVDELKLLVRPLTLEELENEAAAWAEVLKRRTQDITDTEIAIKRQILSIDQKEEAAGKLEEAKKALEEAEEAQGKAEPGTPEYEEVTKQVEEAKENLKQAEDAIEEAAATQESLKDDEGLQEALNKAQRQSDYDAAQETLERAEKEREELDPGSAEYEKATEKIDKLKEAIEVYDEAGEIKGDSIPDTPEFEKASKDFLEAYKAMNEAREAIDGVEPTEAEGEADTDAEGEADTDADAEGEVDPTEQSSEAIDETAALLEATEIEADAEEKVAGSPDVVESEGNLEEKQEQLDKASEKLEESAEEESDLKNNLVETVAWMKDIQVGIIDRLKVVLDEIDRKGGNTEAYRQYIEAVSVIEIDVTDTEGLWVRLGGWLRSEEGGLRWVMNLATFLGVLIASMIASRILANFTEKLLLRYGDESKALRDFIIMLIKRGGIVIGVLLALTALEVSLGPIIALVGGASFVLAFALQSNLGNFASGLTLMLTNPFDVGDEVKIAGLWGYVDSITLASTKLKGWDAQIITLPNSMVWGGIIENLTAQEIRKGGVPVLISFDTNLRKVKEILQEIGNSHPLVLKDRSVGVYIYKGTEHFVWTGIKYWSKTDDYWTVYEDLAFMIQERFQKEGISMAMPQQQDLRIQYLNNGQKPELDSPVPKKAFQPHDVSNTEKTKSGMDLDVDVDVDVPDFM